MSRKLKYKSGTTKKTAWVLKGDATQDLNRVSGTHIEMISNREICVEGCVGVLEYTDVYLKLNLGKGMLIIIGNELDIVLFEGKNITICGNVNSVEFCV